MQKIQQVPYTCPVHRNELFFNPEKNLYSCKQGCVYPVVYNIPRFISRENYASSFGLQWNTYAKTQLDSNTGISISKDRLKRIVGGSLKIFRNKTVLEAGCGAGRFTEIMLQAGADVLAVDMSDAVEANLFNCMKYENYSTCQADIVQLPLPYNLFDIVICIGVIQHTPDPEQTITSLISHLKPGGFLFIDHYSHGYPTSLFRKILRFYLKNMNNYTSLKIVKGITWFLWPIHVFLFNHKNLSVIYRIRNFFLLLSPVVDYHDNYNDIGKKLLYEWAILDTYDTLTDYYKHIRSTEEIIEYLTKNGMINIETFYSGNGVEARAVKPLF